MVNISFQFLYFIQVISMNLYKYLYYSFEITCARIGNFSVDGMHENGSNY